MFGKITFVAKSFITLLTQEQLGIFASRHIQFCTTERLCAGVNSCMLIKVTAL
jgi:hypothetical protein